MFCMLCESHADRFVLQRMCQLERETLVLIEKRMFDLQNGLCPLPLFMERQDDETSPAGKFFPAQRDENKGSRSQEQNSFSQVCNNLTVSKICPPELDSRGHVRKC